MNRVVTTWLLILALIAATVASCGGSKTAVRDFDADTEETKALDARVTTGIVPQPDQEVAVMEVANYGIIVIELYPNVAPKMVAQFKQLINEGFYNGTAIHRIDSESGIIQGGDPLSRDDDTSNDGSGDSSHPNVPGEMSDIPFERGIVGAARKSAEPTDEGEPAMTEAQARDTANCQFFISLKPQPQYDRKYTVFGKVIQGIDAAEIIMRAPVLPETDHPADQVLINSISLQPRAKFVSRS